MTVTMGILEQGGGGRPIILGDNSPVISNTNGSMSISYTPPAGTTMIVVCGCWRENGGTTPAAIKMDGVSMTAGRSFVGDSNNCWAGIYYTLNPTIVSHTFSMASQNSQWNSALMWIVAIGAAPGAIDDSGSGSTTPSLTPTSDNDLILSIFSVQTGSATPSNHCTNSGLDAIVADVNDSGSQSLHYGCGYNNTHLAGAHTYPWSIGASIQFSIAAAVAIKRA